jgi:Mn-dependent DtxR family transcriptional regulator
MNRTLRPMVAELIDGYTQGQMTYDLRRLRRKGLIQRIPKSQRYQLTDLGRMIAVFFTKTYVRILNPALAQLDPHLPEEIANQSDLARSWHAFERAIERLIQQAAIAA